MPLHTAKLSSVHWAAVHGNGKKNNWSGCVNSFGIYNRKSMQIQSVFSSVWGGLDDHYQDDVGNIMSQHDCGYYLYWSTSWAAPTSHCLSHAKSSSPRPKNSDTYTWQFIMQRHGQRAQLNRLQLDWMMTVFAEMLNTLCGSFLKKNKQRRLILFLTPGFANRLTAPEPNLTDNIIYILSSGTI